MIINNDILRRIRYVFDFSDTQMKDIFRLANYSITPVELKAWLTKEDEPGFSICEDTQLASFLNGLIIKNRGMIGDSPPEPEKHLSNNMILMKLKIAMNLKSDEFIEIMTLSNTKVSKHEVSALFRKPGHKHYRECLDQFLRNFLNGMTTKYRKNT